MIHLLKMLSELMNNDMMNTKCVASKQKYYEVWMNRSTRLPPS